MSGGGEMLLIKALDPDASVKFSEYTGKWYVEANIEIGDGAVLTGVTEHRDSGVEAVNAFLSCLRAVKTDRYIVSRYRGQRREWRWNGAAFVECTRDEVLAPTSQAS